MKNFAIITFKNNNNELYINRTELNIDENNAFHANDEVEFIIDAETYTIVYENVNHKLVKIDDFSF